MLPALGFLPPPGTERGAGYFFERPFFAFDPDRKLLHELEMADTTDPVHGEIYIPYTFILDLDRTICKIYNGWWFVGRPTVEELRLDLRTLMSRRSNWVYSRARAAASSRARTGKKGSL